MLTATPYSEWRHEHAIHHATAGDLDRRGHGDIATLTVDEYLARGPWGRLRYRLYRNPVMMLAVGPAYLMIGQRVPGRVKSSGSPKTSSVWSTNLGIALAFTALAMLIGLQSVLLVYVPVGYIAASAGVYLFFVQHQFDHAYWEHHANWDYATAAVMGCSSSSCPACCRGSRATSGCTTSITLQYDWPGNVRELENAIERGLAVSSAPRLPLAALPDEVRRAAVDQPRLGQLSDLSYRAAVDLARDRASREYLVALMRACAGNVTQAAERAAMERESLHRLLKRYGIRPEDFRVRSDA